MELKKYTPLLLCFFLFLFLENANAQNLILHGCVKTASGENPVPGATVILNKPATKDAIGNFQSTGLAEGNKKPEIIFNENEGLLNAVVNYKLFKFEFGISAENLLNTIWSLMQFDTQSRLTDEPVEGIDELNLTQENPFLLKASVTYNF
jgi:hypothetical protein